MQIGTDLHFFLVGLWQLIWYIFSLASHKIITQTTALFLLVDFLDFLDRERSRQFEDSTIQKREPMVHLLAGNSE